MSRMLKRLSVGVIAVACIVAPTVAVAGGKAEKAKARMTGGGNVYGTTGSGATVKVTHGFELHCRAATNPQRLQINWSGGRSFHLTDLTFAYCTDEGYQQENPSSPIDTYYGEGEGRINLGNGNKDTGTAEWRLVDDGEPGGANDDGGDQFQLVIRNSDGDVILEVDDYLRKGNHQAHRSTGSKA